MSTQPAESVEPLSQPEPPPDDSQASSDVPPPPPPPPPPAPPSPVTAGRIQWGVFFQTASPLAALTGFLAFLFFPVAALVILPLGLRRTINRYRRFHAGLLSPRQGAGLGAFMALLSFASFLIFFLATLSLKKEALLKTIEEQAARHPDPQSQQVMAWLSTSQGIVFMTVSALLVALAILMAVGAISGALMAAPPKKRL